MQMIHFVSHKLRVAARVLENPKLVDLRRKGVVLDLYEKLHSHWLSHQQIGTIIDVGANLGQFALAAHYAIPQARIVSFEPLPDCFAVLKKTMEGVPHFEAFNLALGEKSGNVAFQRSAFCASSSCLKMAEAHKTAFPETSQNQTVTVQMERLDGVASRLDIVDPLLLKIDVQGYEECVLRGGEQTARRARIIILETSFETLYEGQPLFDHIYRLLFDWGFSYRGAIDELRHPTDGRLLQADSVFVRI